MAYYKQDEVKKTVNKCKNGEIVYSDEDCIPEVTWDLAKILLGCPDSYLEITNEDDGEEYEIKAIIPGSRVTNIRIRRVKYDKD